MEARTVMFLFAVVLITACTRYFLSLRKPADAYKDFSPVKIEKKNQQKMFDIFLIFAQNIDCGYRLEPPRPGSSNEYPQSMFWSKNKKK